MPSATLCAVRGVLKSLAARRAAPLLGLAAAGAAASFSCGPTTRSNSYAHAGSSAQGGSAGPVGTSGGAAGSSGADPRGGVASVPEDPQLAGAPGDGGTPEAPPTFRTDFGSAVRFTPRSTPPNRIEYVRGPFLTLTRLVLVGDAERSAEDRVGPAFATEVASNESFGFGEYRFRVNLPACAAGEEAVSGLFVYQNGGDANGNGITDNSEIDIEVLCSEPHRLWLSVWTDYEEAEGGPRFRKHTRVVDARDGSYRESVSAERYELGPTAQPNAALRVPLFGQSGVFQELGFVWQPDLVRFFVVSAGRAVTLWELEGAEKIPTQPAQVMANLWHPAEHWSSGTAADYPAADLELELDSFAFWAALPAAP